MRSCEFVAGLPKAELYVHHVGGSASPRLAGTGVPLEVCPSSNVATRAVETLARRPLRTFVDAEVRVTINSDDPPMLGTTLSQEYEIAAELLDLDRAGLADLAWSAINASVAPDDMRQRVLREIDEYTDFAG